MTGSSPGWTASSSRTSGKETDWELAFTVIARLDGQVVFTTSEWHGVFDFEISFPPTS